MPDHHFVAFSKRVHGYAAAVRNSIYEWSKNRADETLDPGFGCPVQGSCNGYPRGSAAENHLRSGFGTEEGAKG